MGGGGANISIAQTSVSGVVFDQHKKPVSFANVVFENSSVGTTTSADGTFFLESDKNYNALTVSLIGYQTKTIKLHSKNTKHLKITIAEGEELSEITVVAKPKKALKKEENPAYKILQGIWKNKNRNAQHTFEYPLKNTVLEVGLTNIDTSYSKYLFGKEAHILQNKMNESDDETYNIPLFMNHKKEVVSTIDGKKTYSTLSDSTIGIVDKNFELERICAAIKNFNVYDNSLMILDKPFVSPISEFGYRFYLYVLSDILYENNEKLYKVYYFPKIDEDIALQGSFTVYDSIFAIKSIDMQTHKKANINLVKSLFFKKDFEKINDNIGLKRDIYEAEFSLSDNESSTGFYLKNHIVFSNESANPTASLKSIYGESIENTQQIIQRVGNNRRMKFISNTVSALASGFIDINSYLQFGSFWEVLGKNDFEGLRAKIGFRSFTSTEDRFRTYFYGAVSTKNHQAKYGVSAMYLLLEKPRLTIGASYQNDFFQQGGISGFPEISSLRMRVKSTSLFSRGNNFFITHNRKAMSVLDLALQDNLHLALVNTKQYMQSSDEKRFSLSYLNNGKIRRDLIDYNTALSVIYTPKRNVFGNGVEQRYGQNLYSTYSFSVIQGFKGVLGSDFSYTKLQARVQTFFPVQEFGLFKTAMEAGKVFQSVPLSLLYPIASNQTYSNSPGAFSLLDYYDLITDTYFVGHFEHHFNGYILNKIPLIKQAQLRFLVLGRVAYGRISQNNIDINRSNLQYVAPSKPYWEYGFGIENIGSEDFRPFRVDFIWRGSFEDYNGIKSPNFGIRLGIYPDF